MSKNHAVTDCMLFKANDWKGILEAELWIYDWFSSFDIPSLGRTCTHSSYLSSHVTNHVRGKYSGFQVSFSSPWHLLSWEDLQAGESEKVTDQFGMNLGAKMIQTEYFREQFLVIRKMEPLKAS